MNKEIIGYDRASVLDLAMIAGGNIDCAFELAISNSINITDEIIIGRVYNITLPEQLITIRKDEVCPATAISPEDISVCPYGGIGYMGVGVDFVVN